MRARVLFVVTEHPSWLDPPRVEGYERIRRRLERLSGRPVESVHYTDVGTLDANEIVLSGAKAPWTAHAENDLARLGDAVLRSDRPVLGICAGLQLLTMFAGGEVEPMANAGRLPERGFLPLEVLDDGDLLDGLGPVATVYQDHEDEITVLPDGFRVLARTPGCEVQAVAVATRRWWGTQFHPESSDAEHPDGDRVIANFFALAERS